jgi:hypothetical protein
MLRRPRLSLGRTNTGRDGSDGASSTPSLSSRRSRGSTASDAAADVPQQPSRSAYVVADGSSRAPVMPSPANSVRTAASASEETRPLLQPTPLSRASTGEGSVHTPLTGVEDSVVHAPLTGVALRKVGSNWHIERSLSNRVAPASVPPSPMLMCCRSTCGTSAMQGSASSNERAAASSQRGLC